MKMIFFLISMALASCAFAVDAPNGLTPTNGVPPKVVRVQCHSVTKSGNRCKRKAPPGKMYCRQHSAPLPSTTTPVTCSHVSDDGKRCTATAAQGSWFCSQHTEK